jgi:GT2 family glycosyltransferase/glycosyltransferase involved in cell wall biosynthesis
MASELDAAQNNFHSFRRGSFLGQLEGLDQRSGLVGWAIRLPSTQGDADSSAEPLRLQLTLEDLLNPAKRWKLAELETSRPRPDLRSQGLPGTCGFAFLGHNGRDLPPRSSGMVVRAFFDSERTLELPGSPLRIDAERYQLLRQLCRTGFGRDACLGPVHGALLAGWARGAGPYQLRIDGAEAIPIPAPDPLPEHEWPLQLRLPPSCCDGCVHHFQLEKGGEPIDESFDLVPAQLTPWSALQVHGRPPFPDHLAPLAREHHRSLTTWLQWADADGTPLPTNLPLLQRLLSHPVRLDRDGDGLALPAGTEPGPAGDAVPRKPLHLPIAPEPQVSVVVPVHNQYAVTRRCLAALAYSPTRVPFEVIVVDDGSSDGTADALAQEAPGVKVMRHGFARGFNQACCTGVAEARAPYVVLLNNDTEPCANWLEELLFPFEHWPDTGVVGAQLVLPDGRLQEAGCIVWGDGSPWNYGRTRNPHEPAYAYARQVDYVSAAALMISTELWRRVGGFSPEFSPAYFEDTDLAFKVREAGFTVRYTPLARVIHHEGLSNGSDPEVAEGLKKYQEINGPLFQRKWAASFDGPTEPTYPEAERIKDRGILGRALFLDHDTPRPDRDAGSHAALVEMDLVQSLGYKVTLLPANLAWLGTYTEALQRRGIEVIHAPFVLSRRQFLEERGQEFDLVYVTRYTIAAESLPLLREHAPQAKLLFCNADLHYLRQLRAARAEALDGDGRDRALEAVQAVKQRELEVMRQVNLTLSYSEVERAVIEAETLGEAPTAACPWVVEGPDQPAPRAGRSGVAFLGSYGHPPNRDAVDHFLEQVWPQVHQQHPSWQFHIYGSGLSRDLAATWQAIPGVQVEGWIADVAQLYQRHELVVAPLRSGAGIKGKVMAAAAHGMPQVLSPLAAESTGLRHGQEVWIASTPEQWVEAIEQLCSNPQAWQRMSTAAHAYAREHFGRAQGLALMREALRRLDLPTR